VRRSEGCWRFGIDKVREGKREEGDVVGVKLFWLG
jgi:hypothetical protein